MSYYGWKPYVSVAKRRAAAEKAAAKAVKAGKDHAPITPFSGGIAKTFWGKSWCENLERYSDYENRLPRGRTYVRNGSVIDLKLDAGRVQALVMGSRLYQVEVAVEAVAAMHWQGISADCAGSIDSMVELLQGKLSMAVMTRICQSGDGLFPTPKEIKFTCSCPDWASMCKHVAAVLYGIGKRLDQQPELLFTLRKVDAQDLVSAAGAGLRTPTKKPGSAKMLDTAALEDIFGIELAEEPRAKASVSKAKATTKIKVKAKLDVATKTKKPEVVKKAKKAKVKQAVPVKKIPIKAVARKASPVASIPAKPAASRKVAVVEKSPAKPSATKKMSVSRKSAAKA